MHVPVRFPPDIARRRRDPVDMDEATALLMTLEATAPDGPTACAGWTAHDLVAHLAAGAAEMADLTEATLAGAPPRATKAFGDREAPYAALPDDELRSCLFTEALRLNAAVEALAAAGPGSAVAFSGRQLTAADLAMHGRSEAALHRWDLTGDDDISRELLAQPELTVHAASVLNEMVDGSAESVGARAAAADLHEVRLAFASPGQPDVVLVADASGCRFELDDPTASPVAIADPATRLLALWGRRTQLGPVTWSDDAAARAQLTAALWSPARDEGSSYPNHLDSAFGSSGSVSAPVHAT
jgi:uncharacterized protein (TIGR03083 family)